MTARVITLDPEPFGVGIDMRVRPAPPGSTLDREFATVSEARAAALALCDQHGWLLIDRVEGEFA